MSNESPDNFVKTDNAWVWYELTTIMVIGTECIDCCKVNYHMLTTKTIQKQQEGIYGLISSDKSSSNCIMCMLTIQEH
jgi:hypothetical protein